MLAVEAHMLPEENDNNKKTTKSPQKKQKSPQKKPKSPQKWQKSPKKEQNEAETGLLKEAEAEDALTPEAGAAEAGLIGLNEEAVAEAKEADGFIKRQDSYEVILRKKQQPQVVEPVEENCYSVWILFCSFTLLAFSTGHAYAQSPLVSEWMLAFGVERTVPGWIASINIAMTFIAGPLAAELYNRIGMRLVVLGGILCTVAGQLLSAFGTNLTWLIVTHGFISGLGQGFVMAVAMVVCSFFFSHHQSMALGLAMAGIGAGPILFPPVIRYLIRHYSWRFAVIADAAIIMHGCILAMFLIKPETSGGASGGEKRKSKAPPRTFFNNLDFYLYMAALFTWNIAGMYLFAYLSNIATELGYSADNGARLVSNVGFSSLAARAGFAVSVNWINVTKIHPFNVGHVIRGLGILLMPFGTHIIYTHVCCAMFGIGSGIQLSLLVPCAIEVFGVEEGAVVASYGLLGPAVGSLTGSPMVAWLFGVSGSYTLLMVLTGSMTILTVIPCAVMRLRMYRRRRTARKPEVEAGIEADETVKIRDSLVEEGHNETVA